MKKLHTYILFVASALVLASCVGGEDDIFDQDAVERLQQSAVTCAERLTANGGTWAIELYPSNEFCFDKYEKQEGYETLMATNTLDGVGFLVLAQFNNDGTVRVGMNNCMSNMISDHDNYKTFAGGDYFQSPTNYAESVSLWELITDMGPVLSFSTFNDCLGSFSNPDNYEVNLSSEKNYRYEGKLGTGLGGDYEFVVVDLEEGAKMAMLKGKKRRTYNRMTLLPEGTDFNAYILDVDAFKNKFFPRAAKNDVVMHIGSDDYLVRNVGSYMPNIFPYGGDPILQEDNHSYLITKRDGKYYLRFRSALGREGQQEQEFCYNEQTNLFEGVKNKANYIRGLRKDELASFLGSEGLVATIWDFKKGDGTSKFEKLLADVEPAFSNYDEKYKLSGITVTTSEGGSKLNVVFSYVVRASKKTYNFAYAISEQDGKLVLSDLKYSNSEAKNMAKAEPAIKALADAFLGEFDMEYVGSNYDINTLQLTSTTDPELVITLKRK